MFEVRVEAVSESAGLPEGGRVLCQTEDRECALIYFASAYGRMIPLDTLPILAVHWGLCFERDFRRTGSVAALVIYGGGDFDAILSLETIN